MLRSQKPDAKYNVTTDFPHLGLHQAAATGNVGLVKYALQEGQPINSVLDGVLPLHAAASGGSEIVVRLLIDAGADVNAPRLPRRYITSSSSHPSHHHDRHKADRDRDRDREPRMPVGTSGSTPLHFAAANGHEAVVRILLKHGARADKPDKNGILPEKVARDNGWVRVADILRDWAEDRDRDLRERDEIGAAIRTSGASGDNEAAGSMSKRLRVKRSIEGLLLRHSSSQQFSQPSPTTSEHPHISQLDLTSSPKPLGEYTFYPTSGASVEEFQGTESRRPSLPQIHEHGHHTVPLPHFRTKKSRRPRSAGTDAEDQPLQSTGRKLGTKYSLMNMLRKSTETPDESPKPSLSPIPRTAPLPGTSPSAVELHHALSNERLRARDRSGSGSGSAASASASASSRPGHRILLGHGRSSSGGQSSPHVHPPPSSSYHSSSSPLAQPARLRFDSTSTNNSAVSLVPGRRPLGPGSGLGLGLGLRACSSANSLGRHDRRGSSTERHAAAGGAGHHMPDSAPPGVGSFDKRHGAYITEEPAFLGEEDGEDAGDEDEEEDEYGEPLDTLAETSRIRARFAHRTRMRGRSIGSSTSSLSPILSPGAMPDASGAGTGPSASASGTPNREVEGTEFPFSITQPPPADEEPEAKRLGVPAQSEAENRMRGGSVSSMSTSTSAGGVATPAPATRLPLPVPRKFSLESIAQGVPMPDAGSEGREGQAAADVILGGKRGGPRPSFSSVVSQASASSSRPSLSSGLAHLHHRHGRRPSHPRAAALGIDLSEISSRQEAEALVLRAERSILDLDLDADGASPDVENDGPMKEWGMSPLSARLAAYGESLAIQRMMQQEEQERLGEEKMKNHRDKQEARSLRPTAVSLERQSSLDAKTSVTRKKRRAPKMKRPHTSGATDQGWDNTWQTQLSASSGSGSGSRVRHLPFRSISYTITAEKSTISDDEQELYDDVPDSADTGITIVETCPTPIQTPIEPTGFRKAVSAEMERTHSSSCPNSNSPSPARPLTPDIYYSDEGSTIGVPLSRVSTAPLPSSTPGVSELGEFFAPSHPSSSGRRDLGVQAKHHASVNKLARMGFSGPAVTGAAQAKPKFGGFRSLVQSLKGRS